MLDMTDVPRIISSEIIQTEQDVFWEDLSAVLGELPHKNVLIISAAYGAGSDNEAQLLKMLGACQLSDADYNIIQLEQGKQMSWNRLRELTKPEAALLVGVLPKRLGIAALFRLNSVNNFDGIKWIPTLSLPELEQQPNAKKELWLQALKPLFVDKTVK